MEQGNTLDAAALHCDSLTRQQSTSSVKAILARVRAPGNDSAYIACMKGRGEERTTNTPQSETGD